jgi:hypothetical protein
MATGTDRHLGQDPQAVGTGPPPDPPEADN